MSSELTNSDFRRIFDNYEKEKKEKENNALLKEEKKLKRKQKYLTKKKKNEEKDEQKYRDRAEERRKGIIKDVEDVSVLYNNVNNTIDESKFMGGDVEHTHLVKGLDFLLLNKVRNKLINKISSEKEKLKGNKFSGVSNKIPYFKNEESKHIFKYFFLYEHPHHIYFKKKIQNIYDNIINNMKFKNYNRNIHLVNYKYNIHMDVEKNDVPIKYIYNIDDIKMNRTYYLKNVFLNEIDTCFKWHIENKKRKKHERLSKRPLTTYFSKEKKIESDDDIDIFKNDGEAVNNDVSNSENDASVDIVSSAHSFRDAEHNISEGLDEKHMNNDDRTIQKCSGVNLQKGENSETNIHVEESNINLFTPPTLFKKENNKTANDNKNSLTKNVFADTYEECYPGYGNNGIF
ncbi:RED-like protein, putative [Plasmodium ovale wallikeri]|uniref:RED-like protein, putative n=2 Tax=Plasmodium ovale TaxID=36330 RepID=A0A1A8ZUD3_PLAOA|nr:RED-like protein, putative [Plasmodium ovale wallikeri]SBT47523.1 RED-like protein, putative [Plasmodium ovale wallikeri]SBT82234.1 RED-like protein, putative [Plasmodium ovale]